MNIHIGGESIHMIVRQTHFESGDTYVSLKY